MQFDRYFRTVKQSVADNKELSLGIAIFVGALVVVGIVAAVVYAITPKIVYQPVDACDLLTPTEAKSVLGNNAIHSSDKSAQVSGDTATSQCGYTDGNPDTNSMVVAAVMVRSGINDKGVTQNKMEFTAGKPKTAVEDVKGIGDSAYFNQANGQLNVLRGRQWVIISYGVGAAPQNNTVESAVELAKKII